VPLVLIVEYSPPLRVPVMAEPQGQPGCECTVNTYLLHSYRA